MAIKATLTGKKLTLVVDLDLNQESKSGKSILLASTGGFFSPGLKDSEGKNIQINLNVLVPKK